MGKEGCKSTRKKTVMVGLGRIQEYKEGNCHGLEGIQEYKVGSCHGL